MQRTKALCNKLFPATASLNAAPIHHLISDYFSLLHSSLNPSHLRHLHARLLRLSLFDNVILSSKLMLMYSHHPNLTPQALSVFTQIPHKNIYSWNILIGALSRSNSPGNAIPFFRELLVCSDCRPDAFTVPLVLRACAGAGTVNCGVSVHGLGLKLGVEGNVFVASALVVMYVTFEKIQDARKVFDGMTERDAVLWTAMLAGYAQNEEPVLGLSVFREMVGVGVELDGVVMVSLLLMCGQSGWLKHGKSVHGWCFRRFLGLALSLGNAVIDMYVKCAGSSYAQRVFDGMRERDVITWSSLILGYGLSGCVDAAFGLFNEMLHCKPGVKPNGVTFLGVLSACVHGGMVEKARPYFRMMEEYGVVAELKHYACMVDCFGRAGLVEEAERFIEEMPLEPDGAVLGALLGGCRVHGNFEVGERIAKRIIMLEPERAGYYVLLANMYADAGRYGDAERVREFMKQRNVSKATACSLIESNNCPSSLASNSESG